MSQTEDQKRCSYLESMGLLGETTDEEDKELEELKKKLRGEKREE